MRARYQHGCISKERRKAGPAVWIFRYRDGQKKNRKVILGTLAQLPTKAAARKASEHLRVNINNESFSPRTVSELVTHYTVKELAEDSKNKKSFSTRTAYKSYFKNRILPAWGEYRLSEVKTVKVEEWLGTLPLVDGSKAKIRNIMSTLFRHAMRHEWLGGNPITLVRQSAKRERGPDVLTAKETSALLAELENPYHLMTLTAAVTGLRVSELLALKWQDIDFAAEEITVCRGIVCQVVGQPKTETSTKPLPMNDALATALLDWRKQSPYNQNTDWVFASADKQGRQPLWPSSAMSKHIRPAAKRAGIAKHVRWHVFRHSFATMLKANGEDVKTTQELLRHADSKMTLDTYTQGLMPLKREAQARVISQLFPCVPTGPTVASASS
ncbi:MAG: tyrosine-type recombinase/integrase [Terriglobales bacterium]|jgi:integrase